jgi:hypothetical protein
VTATRFNQLTRTMVLSLEELRRAIKGLTGISEELEQMSKSLINNEVRVPVYEFVSFRSRLCVNRVAYVRVFALHTHILYVLYAYVCVYIRTCVLSIIYTYMYAMYYVQIRILCVIHSCLANWR